MSFILVILIGRFLNRGNGGSLLWLRSKLEPPHHQPQCRRLPNITGPSCSRSSTMYWWINCRVTAVARDKPPHSVQVDDPTRRQECCRNATEHDAAHSP